MAWVEPRGTGFRVRLRMPDGTVVTDSIYRTRPAALLRAKEIDVEHARDTFLDPRRGQVTLTEWVALWEPTHTAGPAKWAAYRSHLRNHILPRFGHLPLPRIDRLAIKAFVKELKGKLSDHSVRDITLLSMLLREAVADRRIPFNPCHGIKAVTGRFPERPHATPNQVYAISRGMRRTSDHHRRDDARRAA